VNEAPLFVFGTLRCRPLRDIVLGDPEGVRAIPATLAGVRTHWVAGADYPVLIDDPDGSSNGLLLDGLDPTHRARLDFFEGGFDYDLVPANVETAEGPRDAVRYRPSSPPEAGGPWSLAEWEARHAPRWLAAAEEAMDYFGRIDAETLASRMSQIWLRAASRVRAAAPLPATVRSAATSQEDVETLVHSRPYGNYFTVVEKDLSFRRFDGSWSDPATRAGFVSGDAVTVLPYDPVADTALVIEQFRVGPHLRGDPMPWVLEPIAGRVEPDESVETTARREAQEETGLDLGTLHFISGHYPSPGMVAEYVYSYVAEAYLADQDGTVAGAAEENEDIRSHVVPLDSLIEMVRTGEVASGPLVISVLWLALNRDRLRAGA